MRTIIAGSRTILRYETLLKAMANSPIIPTVIISGRATGPDLLGERYARENNIPLELHPANWKHYGKRAGFIRNTEMASQAEALIALYDGESRGTNHMIKVAADYGLVTYVYLAKEVR